MKNQDKIQNVVKLLSSLGVNIKKTKSRLDIINTCLLYTSDAADDMQCVDLCGRRIIIKKKS
ncbi:hypothetical protein CDFC105_64229 [Clostridioides difficile]|nr:hypothetical protein CDFC105_64229 [Clostridioides difficile]